MQRALAIYGRDRIALWNGDEVALGVCLARLLPEDRYDRQPLAGAGGRFRLLADVRLDNRPELADELGIPSHDARGMADADLVLAAWEAWQEGAVGRLVGDFALAIWDAECRQLHLARDAMGQRPLFYHRGEEVFAFASMVKGLHALPNVPKAPDLQTLRDYIALAPHRGPGSLFAGVNRVEPGSLVTLHADGRETRTDWYDFSLWRRPHASSDSDYVEALRATFERAVADRLRGTGAVASHLSGGLDSTAVSATAASLLSAGGMDLTAYTHVPLEGAELERSPGRLPDEWEQARQLAALHPNMNHVRVEAADRMMGGDLDAQFHYFEHPSLNLCNMVWMREIAQLAARQGHKILLTGAMGNLTISLDGLERPAELLRAGKLLPWFRESLALSRNGHSRLAAFFGLSLAPYLPTSLVRALRTMKGSRVWKLSEFSSLRRDIAESRAFQARMKAVGYDFGLRPFPSTGEAVRFALRRTDLAGLEQKGHLAAFGIDLRDPTADRRLVELVLSMPSSMFLRNGQTKWIYHQAFADRVPEAIRLERRRGYQAADWAERFRRARPLLEAQMKSAASRPGVADIMEAEEVLSAIREGPPEGPPDFNTMVKYRLKTLRGLSVAHFIAKMDQANR